MKKRQPKKLAVPQEHPSNPMRGYGKVKRYAVQPHNFRRYFPFSKQGFNPTQPYSLKNYNSEYHFADFYGCRIVVRKNTVEVINLWHKKQWRIIEVNKDVDADNRIREIKAEMTDVCVKALKRFVGIHGGTTNFKPLPIQRSSEIGIHGDDFIDKIPRDMIIHDTNFKKVYSEKLEFLGEASVKNYIRNRSLEAFSPVIAEELKRLEILVGKSQSRVLDWLFDHPERAEWFNKLCDDDKSEVLGL